MITSIIIGSLPILAAAIPFAISQFLKWQQARKDNTPERQHNENTKIILTGSDDDITKLINDKLQKRGLLSK